MSIKKDTYWTAFYTKPRNEKKAAERLLSKGLEVYCPTTTVIKQWSDRKKKIKEPVFSSYIFARVNEAERQQILTDPSIVSSVFWLKKPVVIRQNEIDAIKRFLQEFPQEIKSVAIAAGDRAMISAGPLRGEEGVVVERRGNKALLQLQSLGLELQAEVSINKLDTVK